MLLNLHYTHMIKYVTHKSQDWFWIFLFEIELKLDGSYLPLTAHISCLSTRSLLPQPVCGGCMVPVSRGGWPQVVISISYKCKFEEKTLKWIDKKTKFNYKIAKFTSLESRPCLMWTYLDRANIITKLNNHITIFTIK